jgi:hypothetical protein
MERPYGRIRDSVDAPQLGAGLGIVSSDEAAARFGIAAARHALDDLGRLLGHPVELNSRVGHGSRFSVLAPLVARPHAATVIMQVPSLAIVDPAHGKRVIVIDDDRPVLDGMRGILQSWGWVSMLLWRLTSIILKIEAPWPAADVRKPDRSEWPAKSFGSSPTRSFDRYNPTPAIVRNLVFVLIMIAV